MRRGRVNINSCNWSIIWASIKCLARSDFGFGPPHHIFDRGKCKRSNQKRREEFHSRLESGVEDEHEVYSSSSLTTRVRVKEWLNRNEMNVYEEGKRSHERGLTLDYLSSADDSSFPDTVRYACLSLSPSRLISKKTEGHVSISWPSRGSTGDEEAGFSRHSIHCHHYSSYRGKNQEFQVKREENQRGEEDFMRGFNRKRVKTCQEEWEQEEEKKKVTDDSRGRESTWAVFSLINRESSEMRRAPENHRTCDHFIWLSSVRLMSLDKKVLASQSPMRVNCYFIIQWFLCPLHFFWSDHKNWEGNVRRKYQKKKNEWERSWIKTSPLNLFVLETCSRFLPSSLPMFVSIPCDSPDSNPSSTCNNIIICSPYDQTLLRHFLPFTSWWGKKTNSKGEGGNSENNCFFKHTLFEWVIFFGEEKLRKKLFCGYSCKRRWWFETRLWMYSIQ